MRRTRREFLADVGRGMVVAGIGSAAASDLGIGSAWADTGSDWLNFGNLEPLVDLIQTTPADKMLPIAVEKLKGGLPLETLVSAAGLANARTFGGEDYVGFHTLMALVPAYQMARELPTEKQALPVLKVLHRNGTRINEKGGRTSEVLGPVAPGKGAADDVKLRDTVRGKNVKAAEQIYAGMATSPEDALNHLLPTLHDAAEVHRVVLVSRAWELLPIVGRDQAHTLLRQSVRYCVQNESENYRKHFGSIRTTIPKILSEHRLDGRPLGTRPADDAWIEHLCRTISTSNPEQAAAAAAAALAEGMAPDAVAEAISLATNELMLRDNGRPAGQTQANKPVGSVHGDSIGIHACDSANAWRNIARACNSANAAACLVLAAWQASHDRTSRGGDFSKWEIYPRTEHREAIRGITDDKLLAETEAAIRTKDQARAAALVHRMGELKQPPRSIFDLMLKYAISEDGALHGEKYYKTVTDEYNNTRPAFRWRQLIALARATASAYGQPSAGYELGRKLLGT
jgi:hypothetical protein